jgi:hypothetical protein
MLSILNLAIGLAFIYLLFSLFVTALNELLLSFLDKRADFLKEGLRELLQDPGNVTRVLEHGLVDALSRKTNGNPSYIGAEPFTAAVLDLVRPADPAAVRTIDDFKTDIAALPDSKFKQSLSAILDAANDDLAKFKEGIGSWYDRTMERVSGWYKRYAQNWLFWLSLLLAIACNVDTVHVVTALSSDPKLLQSTVEQASAYVKSNPAPNKANTDKVTQNFDQALTKISNNISNLNGVSVPIGWSADQYKYFAGRGHIIAAILGWFLTALAASLGAPFWFDTLQRFINIKGNGRAPDKKDPLATKKGA